MTKLTKLLFAVIIAATCMSVPAFAEMFTYSPMLTAEYVSKVTGPGLPMSILYTVDSDGHVTREETIKREDTGDGNANLQLQCWRRYAQRRL